MNVMLVEKRHEAHAAPPVKRWYAGVVRPQMDVRVSLDLLKHNVEAFIAWTFRRARTANRAWPEAELRLPGFVWVAIVAEREFGTVRGSLGFERFVSLTPGFGEDDDCLMPTPVPEKQIRGLMHDQIADFEEATRRVRRRESIYAIGEIVTITDGPFASISGPVEEARHGALIVRIAGKFPVRVEESDVMAGAPSAPQRRGLAVV